MSLFQATGHTENEKSFTTDRSIKDFVYIDIKHKHVFTSTEWMTLRNVRSAALLFSNGSEYFGLPEAGDSIDYFVISLDTTDDSRSHLACDVHQVMSQLSSSLLSVVLFEANNNFMFSFAKRISGKRSYVVLSNWYSLQEMQEQNLIDLLDAGYLSGDSVSAFFEDFSFSLSRKYFTHPISYENAAYEMFPVALVNSSEEMIDKETLYDIIHENVMCYAREYQDDYIVEDNNETTMASLSTDDYDLELNELEYGSVKDEFDENTSDENENEKDEDDSFSDMDSEIFDDPIKLLTWIKKHASNNKDKEY